MRATLLILVGLAVVAAGTVLALTSDASEEKPAASQRTPVEEPLPVPDPATMTGKGAVSPAAPENGKPGSMMVYPDGTELPPLNGVKRVGYIHWPSDRPYSPVVRKVVDPNGFEWYEHADGSYSSSKVMWREDLGRYDSIAFVASPRETRPMLPSEIPGGPGGGEPNSASREK